MKSRVLIVLTLMLGLASFQAVAHCGACGPAHKVKKSVKACPAGCKCAKCKAAAAAKCKACVAKQAAAKAKCAAAGCKAAGKCTAACKAAATAPCAKCAAAQAAKCGATCKAAGKCTAKCKAAATAPCAKCAAKKAAKCGKACKAAVEGFRSVAAAAAEQKRPLFSEGIGTIQSKCREKTWRRVITLLQVYGSPEVLGFPVGALEATWVADGERVEVAQDTPWSEVVTKLAALGDRKITLVVENPAGDAAP